MKEGRKGGREETGLFRLVFHDQAANDRVKFGTKPGMRPTFGV